MQEASALRREEARRGTEQKILEEMIRTEKEKAEIDQELNRAKALAEANARVHEEKESEEVTKRMMLERMKGEKEKWLSAINTTFSHIEGFNAFFISNFYEVNLPLSLECPGNKKKG